MFASGLKNPLKFVGGSKIRTVHSSCFLYRELVSLNKATVFRQSGRQPSFKDISWVLKDGENWAIVGSVSSGKTTLAETLAGKQLVQPLSAIQWPFLEGSDSSFPSDHIHLVSFKEDSRMFSYGGHYYQERFNFSDPLNDITLENYLLANLKQPPSEVKSELEQLCQTLGIHHLLPLSFMKLSNGQTRRARIARALLNKPKMLILDEPFMGLDVANRAKISDILGEIASGGQTKIVLISRPQDTVPPWVTNVLQLDKMAIEWTGSRNEFTRRFELQQEKKRKKALVQEPKQAREPTSAEAIVELNNVNVIYSGKKILDNVNWTVKKGEKWALLGPNGSGKTTLLSLMTGDHPQAYANDLWLFGRRRGTGESIWEIKQKIGLLSPELHLYFDQELDAETAAGTGFYDVVVPRKTTPAQQGTVRRLFEEFGMKHLLGQKLKRMSTGEQRMVLLIRSLVKEPPLLVWDEPFQGLDEDMIEAVNNWLINHISPEQTLILVTHHQEEIPSSVQNTYTLTAEGGTQENTKC
ncbi:P-loop containing nucleoside triphosphate hydrolase protein [Basidiobolus meristosporus CBS 931.73]|uniref:p-loop containing nucleoside triphosphate hydrolase protein n=1 Tax=Basidiobolus meristosporus CBS 931.73 TaxID=1314790 RepID=A0A1Y1Z419_9FUNG|nr:P-loop containing nucleoside triphosphate hydrolase protein [Basidiobolus meristosporus CBS 931.73]|eukprot:ORY04585.1 P-loop containing nucleoside triphosphate hydrolase protein [Basidiobolus meristosporus CBS 931.73]